MLTDSVGQPAQGLPPALALMLTNEIFCLAGDSPSFPTMPAPSLRSCNVPAGAVAQLYMADSKSCTVVGIAA